MSSFRDAAYPGKFEGQGTVDDVADAAVEIDETASLASAIDRFAALIEHASEGVVISDAEGLVVYASPLLERLTSRAVDEVVGTRTRDLFHPDDIATILPLFEGLLDTPGMSVECEARCRGIGGRWVWMETTTTNLFLDPRVGGLVTNFRDISHRRAADIQREAVAALGLRALRGAPISELAHDAVHLLVNLLAVDSAAILEQACDDPESMVVRACAGWPENFIGRRMPAPADSPSGRTLARGAPVIIADFATEPDFPTKEMVDAAGVRASLGVPIAGDDGAWGLVGVASQERDRFSASDADFVQAVANVLGSALERDRSRAELARQALHDPLTGLPNRALLRDRVELGLAGARRASSRPFVIQFVDVDNLKHVNDTLGHEVGDELLRKVAARLQEAVRAEDTVARFGGDEFVVAGSLPNTQSLLVSADRILTALRWPFVLDGHEVFVTASIGIAISSGAHDTVETLLRDADAAMYEAKRLGRDRYAIFNNDLRGQLTKAAELETGLRSALDRDELRVYYQPVVNSTTGETGGLEALVRWEHPQRGLISPIEFIPTAESTGMILPIGRLVLQQACEQLARSQRDHDRPDLGVSVNLSPRQLSDPQLVQTIQDALATSGISPSTLRLELTETMIVEDLARATSTLESIAELGVGLVIDDFGTGYSSLSYLKKLPIVCIKIDRSFITDICTDPADRAIVAAVSALARQLGVCAVAEGVETSAQLAAVRDLGCSLIQGFHYSPALCSTDLDTWLARPSLEGRGTTHPPSSPARLDGDLGGVLMAAMA